MTRHDLILELSNAQDYPMPHARATAIDIAEQTHQLREVTKMFMRHLFDEAAELNSRLPITEKVKLGEFSDAMQDAIDGMLGKFRSVQARMEEEECA